MLSLEAIGKSAKFQLTGRKQLRRIVWLDNPPERFTVESLIGYYSVWLESVDRRYLNLPWPGTGTGDVTIAAQATADVGVGVAVACNVKCVECVDAGFDSLFLVGFEGLERDRS